MTDFSVTGIVVLDNVSALASADEVMDATDKATAELATLRRKALSTISMTLSMVSQGYSSLKQLLKYTGLTIDPVFDAMFTTTAAVLSTALSAAIMLSSSLHPALIAIGVALMVVSIELSIKTRMELDEARKQAKGSIYSVPDYAKEAAYRTRFAVPGVF